MPRKIKQAAVMLAMIALAVFVLAPMLIDENALAAESSPRDWDKDTVGGKLKDTATNTEFSVLMDAHTGKVLFEENANERKFPASITKIMTCLVVLEHANLDDVVTVKGISQETLEKEGSAVVGLENDEEITVESLLYGLMLESGGDAAIALANYVAGSVNVFVGMMNEKAAELEMTGTHFVNPIGLHDDNHYTTAMDMAKLSYAAMKIPEFREIVGTFRYDTPETNVHNEENPWPIDRWENRNELVSTVFADEYAYDDANGDHAIGIKTGFTTPSQSTLAAAAESGDGTQEVIAIVLYGTPNGRFSDAVTMFKYAFEFYDTIKLSEFLSEELKLKAHAENAKNNEEYNLQVQAIPIEEGYITDTTAEIEEIKNQPERFTKVVKYTSDLVAPITSGYELGTLDFFVEGQDEPVLSCKLFAANDVVAMPNATATPSPTQAPIVATPTPTPDVKTWMLGYIGYIIGGVAGLILIIVLIVIIRGKSKSKAARYSSARSAAPARGRRADTRFREGVNRGRGRKR